MRAVLPCRASPLAQIQAYLLLSSIAGDVVKWKSSLSPVRSSQLDPSSAPLLLKAWRQQEQPAVDNGTGAAAADVAAGSSSSVRRRLSGAVQGAVEGVPVKLVEDAMAASTAAIQHPSAFWDISLVTIHTMRSVLCSVAQCGARCRGARS